MTNELRVQGSLQACLLIRNSNSGASKHAGPVSLTEFYSSSEYDDDNVHAKIDFKFYNLSQNY